MLESSIIKEKIMNRNRRQIFKYILLTLLLLCSCQPANKWNRPNILLLMSDNHSWNHLGCYGDPVVKTPNIDMVAKQGVISTTQRIQGY